jgi:hypothetical protein
LKDTKEALRRWKGISCSSTGRLSVFKEKILYNLNHRFNAIPTKIPAGSFALTDKLIQKLMRKYNRPRVV